MIYKIQLHVTSFSILTLNSFFKKLNKIFKLNSILLKKKKNKITLLKSPHVHKKSRIQYQFKYFKKLIIFEYSDFYVILYFLKNLQKFNIFNIKYKLKLIK